MSSSAPPPAPAPPASHPPLPRRSHLSSHLPAAVAALRLPPSLPPQSLSYPYNPSPLSPPSPTAASPHHHHMYAPSASTAPFLSPPTTPQTPTNPPQAHHHNGTAPSSSTQNPSNSGTGNSSGGQNPAAAENKRAQNRKSAKRFREAQKLRWKALQEENAALSSEVARLSALLASASIDPSSPAHLQGQHHSSRQYHAGTTATSHGGPGAGPPFAHHQPSRARQISIDALTSPAEPMRAPPVVQQTSPPHGQPAHRSTGPAGYGQQGIPSSSPRGTHAAEARLYARVLGSASPVNPGLPYATELGVLQRCICAVTGAVLRGDALPGDGGKGGGAHGDGVGLLYAGLERDHREALEKAIQVCADGPLALGYCRFGTMCNAVVGPGEDGKAAVVAEFTPFEP